LYTKNTWADRNVEFPNRYTDELAAVKTFTPSPGVITNAGTAIVAAKMNNIENGIETLYLGLMNLKRKLRMGVRG